MLSRENGKFDGNDNERLGNLAVVNWDVPPRRIQIWKGKRPVVVMMPGWSGSKDVEVKPNLLAVEYVKRGYVILMVGLKDQGGWNTDLSSRVKTSLDAVCSNTQIPADCTRIVLNGTSYSGGQSFNVAKYLASTEGGYNTAAKKVIGFITQDAGYQPAGNWPASGFVPSIPEGLASTSQYKIGMIQNIKDKNFNDACLYGSCSAHIMAKYHGDRSGQRINTPNVYSSCQNNDHPQHGAHGARDANGKWDNWVITVTGLMVVNIPYKEIRIPQQNQSGQTPPVQQQPNPPIKNDCYILPTA